MPEAKPDFLADDLAEIEQLETEIKQQEQQPPQQEQVENVRPEQEAPPAPDIDAIDGEDRGQFIRKAALYEERQRRKEATERSRQWEQRYTEDMRKANERLQALFENAQKLNGQTPQAQQQSQIPSVDVDPIGHFQAVNEELKRKVEAQDEFRKQQEEIRKQEDARLNLVNEVNRLEAEYAKTVPDYAQAQEYLFNHWANEARAIGFPEHEITSALQARSIETVQLAARLNKNPAQIAYDRAKALGYRAQQQGQQAAQPQPGKQQPNLEVVAKGMDRAKSASATTGKATAGVPTIEDMLALPDEEFAAKYASPDSKDWARIMKSAMGIT